MEVLCHLLSDNQVSAGIIDYNALTLQDNLFAEDITIRTHFH